MKIIPLSEGTFTIGHSKKFVPYEPSVNQHQSKGNLLVEIQPFAVVLSSDVILLDAGLGFEQNGILQLHQNLQKEGIAPQQVTKVLLTHLHKDHAGGIGLERDGLGYRLAFPNATYYVQRKELAYAFEKGLPSYIPEEIEVLRNNRQVVLLEGDGFIDEKIEYRMTGAHTPFHQVFWIRNGNQTVFFGGDEAPQLNQMKSRLVAKYDYDGKKAMMLRHEWLSRGIEENWIFLFYHDVRQAMWTAVTHDVEKSSKDE
ncbi:MAG: MBL fold metallo-hydrolase [Chitinophagaceae bacterium]|nr:MBL fold metallo-hydrolase [Chitinophagaceae bacterium]